MLDGVCCGLSRHDDKIFVPNVSTDRDASLPSCDLVVDVVPRPGDPAEVFIPLELREGLSTLTLEYEW